MAGVIDCWRTRRPHTHRTWGGCRAPLTRQTRTGIIGVEAFDAAYGAGFQASNDLPHAVECELVEERRGVCGALAVWAAGAVLIDGTNRPASTR